MSGIVEKVAGNLASPSILAFSLSFPVYKAANASAFKPAIWQVSV
jgi:hypothetical protein